MLSNISTNIQAVSFLWVQLRFGIFLRDMDTQKLKNGLIHTITEHEIVSTATIRCYGTDKVMENVVKYVFNSLRQRQNRRHFADVFKCNFLNENVWIPIRISLKFVPKGPINNIPALVQIMAWRRTGDKPLSEPMMSQFNNAYMRHSASMS